MRTHAQHPYFRLQVPLEGSDEVRKFLKDGDLVVMTGVCNERPGVPRVGFGAVEGRVLPAGTIGAAPAAVAEASERYANFVLYSYWRSTCSWRVRTALAAKGLLGTTEIRPVNLLQVTHTPTLQSNLIIRGLPPAAL